MDTPAGVDAKWVCPHENGNSFRSECETMYREKGSFPLDVHWGRSTCEWTHVNDIGNSCQRECGIVLTQTILPEQM